MSNCEGNNNGRIILGIDLGTTSVKVCIIKNKTILATCSKETEATLKCPSEQNVLKIINTLENCILSLPLSLLENVDHIGICGQMHGICLWKYQQPTTCSNSTVNNNNFEQNSSPAELFQSYKNHNNTISNLYTWMDQKCDSKFLNTIPIPDSHLGLSTGHGCVTLFWLIRNKPEYIKDYDCSGTVMDFLVAILCNLQKPIMSDQNAASWGYFNTKNKKWNYEILKNNNFPIHLLPNICDDTNSKQVGTLRSQWLGIKPGTPIGPAFGDLQCSVYSTFLDKNSAFINISTSAQITHLSSQLPEIITQKIEYRPYFQNQYVVTGASLNGGNVLQAFVNSIITFGEQFGIPLNKDFVWSKILLAGKNVNCTDLCIKPTLFGERHCVNEMGSIENISLHNINIGHITRGLMKGLIENLNNFIGIEELQKIGITKIMAGGSALLRNLILQEELKRNYSQFNVQFIDSDSCYGAALYFLNEE